MILVDKDIIARSEEIFKQNFDKKFVQPISYDIHIDEIICENKNVSSFQLEMHDVVMIRCKEVICVPNDLIVRIENKNSLIRLGLTITSPIYNPGHETPIYIRVENISNNIIKIEQNMTIAQMIFEQLSQAPDIPYNKKNDASFNNETVYRYLGKYTDTLDNKIKKIQKIKENLDNKEAHIYANILTLMGIFVSIFSLITVNFASINENNFSKDFILTMNLSLGVVITLFMGLILFFLNNGKNKGYLVTFILIFIFLILLLLYSLSR